MSEQNNQTPVAQNTLNKKDQNTVDVYHASCQCYFRIETLDVVLLSESDARSFDDKMNKLSMLVEKLHQAKKDYSAAIEAYGKKQSDIENKNELIKYKEAIAKSEETLDKATKSLQQEIGEFDVQKGYNPVVELIPLEPLKKGVYGRFYSYIKLADYDDFQKSGKLNIISLKNFGGEDIYKKDSEDNVTGIDIKVLSDKIKKAQKSIKEMMDKKTKAGASIDYETTLTDWASAWNKEYTGYSQEGNYIDVSAAAQFLRFSSNAAYQASWDPDKKSASIKGVAKAELAIFTGKVDASIYVPDRIGWRLKFIINDENKEANLGMLRTKIDTGLTGYAGASAQIEGNLQFVASDGQQKIMGLREPASRFEERQKGVVVQTEGAPPEVARVKAELFAGVKAGGKVGGALQWLKPFNSLVEILPGLLKALGGDTQVLEQAIAIQKSKEDKSHLGEFTDFASLSLGGEVQLGVGFSGDYQFVFEKGRFKFHAAGGLCLGPGAKGDVQGEITPKMFKEFAIWAVYQLYGIDFKHFKIIAKDAFMALSYILVMGGEEVYTSYFGNVAAEYDTVFDDFKEFMSTQMQTLLKAKSDSENRDNFALILDRDPGAVYYFSPEGKGAALYILTGDGAYDRIDYENQGDGFLPDTNHYRKKAILTILSSIQTQREWRKVLTRMTPDGTAVLSAKASEYAELKVVKESENVLRKTLQIGFSQDKELNILIDKLALRNFNEVYDRLKKNPAFGYPFSPNCSKQYFLHCDDSPFYSSLCYFVPEDPTIKNRLESTEK
ncbi:hypothetical protein RHD99_08980 [Buttiauxella selenatireducens]|uniref:Uncharacterized protein n=1 Tax=Buttiauxella selenatireducens TaxID=3073902 RepID=A0ABY9SEX3_9ENTR|nr:hypothetical protein [Buttiauxella sp. R73]WMY76049.1 hypothetical protein RHD99_08980 [Buttiauxella sp. R73]